MIAIITYNHSHRKTLDLITRLFLTGYDNLYIIITPWEIRKNIEPLYVHRPSDPKIHILEICQRLSLDYKRCKVSEIDSVLSNVEPDYILIGGAGILPYNLVKHHKIINSHPGYLPNIKGVDALKWAILKEQPIGVTTHYIDENIDEGILIERRLVPVYYNDTFHSVAYRQYELEIQMLADSISKKEDRSVPLHDPHYTVNRKRMTVPEEIRMMSKFHKLTESQNE
jgi:folate-dependent phosphoribosylglycinamide formyltransferase PurN